MTSACSGVVVLLLSALLLAPVPIIHILPALVIALISLAYLEEDGSPALDRHSSSDPDCEFQQAPGGQGDKGRSLRLRPAESCGSVPVVGALSFVRPA
jgi:Exopolysaccharide synthesis, ExoD